MSVHLLPLLAENSLFKAIGQIFHPLFAAVATVLAYIYSIVPNYFLSIVILTVIIMVLLTPLTIKSTKSMLAMQALQPEMQKLRQKYKGTENREQLNQEMMRLYREHGVSPTGGCLPMFLQMPALWVLYDVIQGLAHTVTRGQLLSTGKHCAAAVCGTPRYIPHSSAMFHNLIQTPGVMKSFGLNLAAKPLTHHAQWYGYVPYFVMVALAVALQYFQMAQMTRRNQKRGTAQIPQQMQMMQRVMPLIFAYIYFIVPAGVVVYMIISSAIRVLTQDLIFRYGIADGSRERRVAARGAPEGEREVGGAGAPAALPARPRRPRAPARVSQGDGSEGALPPRTGAGGSTPAPKPKRPAGSGAGRPPASSTAGDRKPSSRAGTRTADGGRGDRKPAAAGRTNGATRPTAAEKPHPRSKSKRARKAR